MRARRPHLSPRRTTFGTVVVSIVLVTSACGDGDDVDGETGVDDELDDLGAAVESVVDDVDPGAIEEGVEDFAEEAADALGAGGGGTLTFDGEEFAIDSVICLVDGELVDVGTVSDSGYRVFVSRNDEANPIDVQILDPDFLQWFPQGDDPEVDRGDGTFSIDTTTFFNNSDDTVVDASFTIECP